MHIYHWLQNHSVTEDRKVFWTQPSCVPQCLLYHLETFKWRDYDGTDEVEKEMAIYILNNASRLVTATIYYPDLFEWERKLQMSRGSRSCKLTMGWIMKVLCLLLSFGFCLNNASEFRTIVQSTHRRWGGCRIFDIMLIGPIRILLIIGLDSVWFESDYN